jgi:hypothetical protein
MDPSAWPWRPFSATAAAAALCLLSATINFSETEMRCS